MSKRGLPQHRDLYYGGQWHEPAGGYLETSNPATGERLCECAEANAEDVHAAVMAAREGFVQWRKTKPLERAGLLRQVAGILRANAQELAWLDSTNGGNPLREMISDVSYAAAQIEFYAGLVTEAKGSTVPLGEGVINLTVREPYGVVARIVAYNHPLMFTAAKMAPPLAAGNSVIMKPPHQAPLSSYRMMELLDGVLPPGVLNILSCGRAGSEALVAHPAVPRVSLVGSVPTGRAVAKAAADRLKRVTLELGGKNACIIYPDADLPKAARAAIDGMNFTWCGQSCGSTSRAFVHESVYEQVLEMMLERVRYYKPGPPTEMDTTMGAIVSKEQYEKILHYIELGKQGGARVAYGGARPSDPGLKSGYFLQPTVFTEVTQAMRIASEEIFGPILSVIRWRDEEQMLAQVNSVEYGLTGAVWTTSLSTAHRVAGRLESGYIWVNNVSQHFAGVPFGGYKQSGLGREEDLSELHSYTQLKSINISL